MASSNPEKQGEFQLPGHSPCLPSLLWEGEFCPKPTKHKWSLWGWNAYHKTPELWPQSMGLK